MKFKFCSDGDCPLWALSALHALGSLPAPVFKSLLRHVLEEQPDDGIMEILKDTNLSSREECARAAAVLRWTLKQAHRCRCSGVQLARELLVLGVPRAHAAALADAAETAREAHEAAVTSDGFMVNKLTDIQASPGPAGTVGAVTLSLRAHDVFTGEQRSAELLADSSLVADLLRTLRTAREKMRALDCDGD